MILQVLVTLVAILCCSNSAPVPDDGNPAECILETQPDSLSDYKIMSCMLENEIMVYMKDSDLLTFTTEQERQDCVSICMQHNHYHDVYYYYNYYYYTQKKLLLLL